MLPKIATWLYHSPCGDLLLGAYDGQLCMCDWLVNKRHEMVKTRIQKGLKTDFKEEYSGLIQQAVLQFDEYFAGKRKNFELPLLLVGTDFQKKVWNELLRISFGKTISYAELARRIGNPQAVRAVANANGANALPIIIPCHRVIGSNRTLTGFAGGLAAKQFLLNLER